MILDGKSPLIVPDFPDHLHLHHHHYLLLLFLVLLLLLLFFFLFFLCDFGQNRTLSKNSCFL